MPSISSGLTLFFTQNFFVILNSRRLFVLLNFSNIVGSNSNACL